MVQVYQHINGTGSRNSNGGPITPIGPNNDTLNASLISTTNTGTFLYWCTINFFTGDCSQAISDSAEIIVNPDPVISLQPDSLNTICVGGVIDSLTIDYANGVGTPTYQWYKNGIAIPSTDHYSYLPPASDFLTAATIYYYAEVYLSGNGCDTAVSDSAIVIVVNDPLITSIDTATQTICENAIPTDLVVTVQTGSGTTEPYEYLWYNATTGLPASPPNNTATYIPSTAVAGTTYYYCIVTQPTSGCEDISDTVEVIVNEAPDITLDPIGETVCLDANITNDLIVDYINGAGLPVYQWYWVGPSNIITPIGPNNDTLDASLISTANSGTFLYWCTINFPTGSCNEITSDSAEIIVNPDPVISLQPDSLNTICVGGVIDSLTIDYANGVGTPTYQWYKNGIAIPSTDHYSYLPSCF